MNDDDQLEQVFKDLKRSSHTSILMVSLGTLFLLGSIYYSATRLRPLEAKIIEKQQQIAELEAEEARRKKRLAEVKREYKTLKSSTENLYSVRVTPDNQVYELRATAWATGNQTGSGPEYKFSIFINSTPEVLQSIKEVEYTFDHPTFRKKKQTSSLVADSFAVRYVGWGCLSRVGVVVRLTEGTEHALDFNMCRSLGPQWGINSATPEKGAMSGEAGSN